MRGGYLSLIAVPFSQGINNCCTKKKTSFSILRSFTGRNFKGRILRFVAFRSLFIPLSNLAIYFFQFVIVVLCLLKFENYQHFDFFQFLLTGLDVQNKNNKLL